MIFWDNNIILFLKYFHQMILHAWWCLPKYYFNHYKWIAFLLQHIFLLGVLSLVFGDLLAFWPKCLKLVLYFSCPVLKISYFCNGSVTFRRKWYLEQITVLDENYNISLARVRKNMYLFLYLQIFELMLAFLIQICHWKIFPFFTF